MQYPSEVQINAVLVQKEIKRKLYSNFLNDKQEVMAKHGFKIVVKDRNGKCQKSCQPSASSQLAKVMKWKTCIL